MIIGKMEKQILRLFLHFYFYAIPTSVLPGISCRHPPASSVCRIPCRAPFLEGGNKDDTERAVLLQGPPAYPEYAGQFLVRQETFSLEHRLGSLFHVGQHSFQILQSLEKDFNVRVFLLYKMVTHGFLFKG